MPRNNRETERRPAAAALVLRRPTMPLTQSAVRAALAPLVELLDLDLDDTLSLAVTSREVRVQLTPRYRGKRQHNARVRVVWPIAYDPEGDDE